MGRVRAAQDDFHGARKELEEAIRLDPFYMEAYNALGFVMEGLEDDKAALENYQSALRLNEQRHPMSEAPYVNMSGFYNQRGKPDLAVKYAQHALELNPQSDLAYYQIAKADRTRQDWEGVTGALEKAIAIRPHEGKYYYVLSIAYRKLGKIEESQQALQTFEKLQKELAEFEKQRREARRAESGLELRPEE
jgi:tetratricopeptide (TPR) repeat protein